MSVLDWVDRHREVLLERLEAWRVRGRPPVAVRRTPVKVIQATFRDEDRRGRLVWLAVDLVATTAMIALVTLAWLPTYGQGWLWVASFGSAAVGAVVAVVAALRRWSVLATSGLAVAAYALLGTGLAMPHSGIGYVVPTLRSLTGLALGPVYGWKAMLTVEPPIGETSSMMVPVVLTGLVATAAAVSISLRSRRPHLAWLPLAAALLLALAMGTSTVVAPVVLGLAGLMIVLAWTAYRRHRQRGSLLVGGSRLRWTQLVSGLLVLVFVGSVTALVSPLLRSVEPRLTARAAVRQPLDIQRYPSPLQGFRLNLTDDKDRVLFTVSGLPAGTRIRLATMDAYDGFSYTVSNSTALGADAGTFRRIGARVVDDTVGRQVTADVTIGDLTGVWLPTVGQTESVSFSGSRAVALADDFYYNQVSGTALAPIRVGAGDSYRLTAIIPAEPTPDQIRTAGAGAVKQPPAEPLPDVVRDRAATWAASATGTGAGALAQAYVQKLKQGYYSHGVEKDDTPSSPGHTYGRIEQLLRNPDQMVGDEEQYAVAMALLLRAAGVPARVGYGYLLPQSGTASVRGQDVTAWTEVNLGSFGWVPFDPAPAKDRKLAQVTEEPQSVPRPQVENPPPPPQKPDTTDNDTSPPVNPAPVPPPRLPINWQLVGQVALVGGIPVLFIVVPIALIIGLKIRRRRLRMTDADLVRRVSGGWAELVDRARDLGGGPTATATRTEQAEHLLDSFGRLHETADPRVLARQADMSVFSPDGVTPGQASTYWSTVDAAVGGLNRSVPFLRRMRAALSVRSFRRVRAG